MHHDAPLLMEGKVISHSENGYPLLPLVGTLSTWKMKARDGNQRRRHFIPIKKNGESHLWLAHCLGSHWVRYFFNSPIMALKDAKPAVKTTNPPPRAFNGKSGQSGAPITY